MGKKIMLLCISLFTLFVTWACGFTSIDAMSDQRRNEKDTYYNGKGIHIWGWNGGEQTCEVEDEMTINKEGTLITLVSTGPCMSIQGLDPYTCYVSDDSAQCTIKISGIYYEGIIAFDLCGQNEKGTGEGRIKDQKVTGYAKCSDDKYIFSLPLKE